MKNVQNPSSQITCLIILEVSTSVKFSALHPFILTPYPLDFGEGVGVFSWSYSCFFEGGVQCPSPSASCLHRSHDRLNKSHDLTTQVT